MVMADDQQRVPGKERSPNYPSVGLPTAIEAVRKLWQAEKRTPVPPEVAARAIGYNGLSGASRATIAALRHYGLIDVSGGSVTVSDLAVNIVVHSPETLEWREAVKQAANTPDIIRELNVTHSDASDSALNAYLITKRRFSVEGAQRFIRAFRETNALANRRSEGYGEASSVLGAAQGDDMAAPQVSIQSQTVTGQKVTLMQFLLGGGMRAEVRFVGGDPAPSHIQSLEAYLKVTRETLDQGP
jgi:hypothetical protein